MIRVRRSTVLSRAHAARRSAGVDVRSGEGAQPTGGGGKSVGTMLTDAAVTIAVVGVVFVAGVAALAYAAGEVMS